jgi:hypothetical protein
MTTRAHTNAARIAGVLFLIATASYVAASKLTQQQLLRPESLASFHPDRPIAVAAALLVLVDAIVVVSIALVLFPMLRRWSESLSLGYIAFRIMEALLLVVGALGPLSLLGLSPAHLRAGDPVALSLGTLATQGNYWAYQLAMTCVGVGGVMLCFLLHRSRLVPRWLAVLGLMGYPLLATGAVLDMLGQMDTLHGTGMLLLMPGGLFELILPFWLIIKGFSPMAIFSEELSGSHARMNALP